MEEEKEDVMPESSTGEEETPATPEQIEGQEPATEEPSEPQEVKEEVKDDRPLKNLYWEQKRKVDELYDLVKKLAEQKTQPVPQQRQYTKAQLRAFAENPDTPPEHKIWAYEEIDRIEKEERDNSIKKMFETYKSQSDAEAKRREAESWVVRTFPQVVIKDASGNPVAWNYNDPLVKEAFSILNSDERFANAPDGLAGAFEIAYGRLARRGQVDLAKKVNETTAQLRREQKKNLIPAGGGISPTKESSREIRKKQLLDALAKAKTKDQRTKITAELIKLKGLNPFSPEEGG